MGLNRRKSRDGFGQPLIFAKMSALSMLVLQTGILYKKDGARVYTLSRNLANRFEFILPRVLASDYNDGNGADPSTKLIERTIGSRRN